MRKLMIEKDQCDKQIFTNGSSIAIMTGISNEEMNRICEEISNYSGSPTDWHYCGGRAVIKTLGDPNCVRQFLPIIQITT